MRIIKRHNALGQWKRWGLDRSNPNWGWFGLGPVAIYWRKTP